MVNRDIQVEDRLLRLMMALLLVVAQFIGMSMTMPTGREAGRGEAAALLAGGFICHTDLGTRSGGDNRTPAGDHSHDCDLCPACHLAAATAIPVSSASFVPLPSRVFVAKAAFAVPSTGPPGRVRYSARPRGPPVTVV